MGARIKSGRRDIVRAAEAVVQRLEERRMLSATLDEGTWTIEVDDDRNHVISVDVSPNNPSKLKLTIDGKIIGSVLIADLESVQIVGGSGADQISFNVPNKDLWVDVRGGAGNDTISGGAGHDHIRGGKGDDQLSGGDGDDLLIGGGGRDQLSGDGGDDELDGGAASDILAGGLGKDLLRGGRGADQEHGGFDDDVIYGNQGRDTLWGGAGADLLAGGGRIDTVYSESADHVRWGKRDLSRQEELVKPLQQVVDQTPLKQWLIDELVKTYKDRLGTTSWRYLGGGGGYRIYPIGICCEMIGAPIMFLGGETLVRAADVGVANFTSTALALDHSDTNTQVAGVDEADFVETDGRFIYSITGGKLVIISALPAEETAVISSTQIEGNVTGMYLDGDRLVVLSSVNTQIPVEPVDDGTAVQWMGHTLKHQVKVTVFEVSNRANPKISEESYLDGTLNTSRYIDGRLYLIMNNPMRLPEPRMIDVGEPQETEESGGWKMSIGAPVTIDFTTSLTIIDDAQYFKQMKQQYRYETEEEYRARLEGMSLAELLPGYTTRVSGPDGQLIESSGSLVGQIYTPPEHGDSYQWNMSSIVLMDLNESQPGPTATTNIIGMAGQVYATGQSMYLTAPVWERTTGWAGEERTDIYKFALGQNSVDLVATGETPGHTLNSYSMDENGDYFRIATTSDGPNQSSNLFVLRQNDRTLETVGQLTGLGVGQQMFSARFMGDKAYLVTFHNIDPLFTIDLSDPAAPRVAGELEIPGFSNYLHPIGDDYLLGLGGAWHHMQLSLFDVSDMADPRRVDLFKLDDGWSTSSTAQFDPHAFAYFPEYHILALPVEINQSNGSVHETILLKVDPQSGFTKLGTINGYLQGAQRNVRIGDFVYAFFGSKLKVVELSSPDEVVADVELSPPAEPVNQLVEVANIVE
jgi:uncharacterized secreted protein with C-terminal beta-propeller domain